MKTMRTTINFFIVNMAMSDLLFPVFVFPLLLTEIYTSGFGPLGRTICLVLFQLLYISSWVSIQSLILIALDRFVAVVFSSTLPDHQFKTVSICHPDDVDSCDCFFISNVGLL